MSITIQVKDHLEFRLKTSTNKVALPDDIGDSKWLDVRVNGKHLSHFEYSIKGKSLVLNEKCPKNTQVIIKTFTEVKKKNR